MQEQRVLSWNYVSFASSHRYVLLSLFAQTNRYNIPSYIYIYNKSRKIISYQMAENEVYFTRNPSTTR